AWGWRTASGLGALPFLGGGTAGACGMSSYLDLNYRKLGCAAIVLGAVSIMSAGFMFMHGTFQLVQIGAIGLVVSLVLGLLAIAAGLLAERTLMLAAGAGF